MTQTNEALHSTPTSAVAQEHLPRLPFGLIVALAVATLYIIRLVSPSDLADYAQNAPISYVLDMIKRDIQAAALHVAGGGGIAGYRVRRCFARPADASRHDQPGCF